MHVHTAALHQCVHDVCVCDVFNRGPSSLELCVEVQVCVCVCVCVCVAQWMQSKEMCTEMTAKLAEERQHHQVAITEYRTVSRSHDNHMTLHPNTRMYNCIPGLQTVGRREPKGARGPEATAGCSQSESLTEGECVSNAVKMAIARRPVC